MLLDDADAFAEGVRRVAAGNCDHPDADDHLVRDELVHGDQASLEALDLPELPYSDVAYVEMWDRIVTDWRDRNRFRHLRDVGRSRSSILTEADLQEQLGYLSGWPEAQRAAIEAFKERQAGRDAEWPAGRSRMASGAAHIFMKERREFLKTIGRSQKGRGRSRR